jgi:hypothetical protein
MTNKKNKDCFMKLISLFLSGVATASASASAGASAGSSYRLEEQGKSILRVGSDATKDKLPNEVSDSPHNRNLDTTIYHYSNHNYTTNATSKYTVRVTTKPFPLKSFLGCLNSSIKLLVKNRLKLHKISLPSKHIQKGLQTPFLSLRLV